MDGTIGFVDDYIKIFKKDKQGLKGIFKYWTSWIGYNCRFCMYFIQRNCDDANSKNTSVYAVNK
jgi:UDP-N-acetylmuramyl pentapeptide phosphotransferase/UDP-N-acetylglucosamine-1-phosphate transferase